MQIFLQENRVVFGEFSLKEERKKYFAQKNCFQSLHRPPHAECSDPIVLFEAPAPDAENSFQVTGLIQVVCPGIQHLSLPGRELFMVLLCEYSRLHLSQAEPFFERSSGQKLFDKVLPGHCTVNIGVMLAVFPMAMLIL